MVESIAPEALCNGLVCAHLEVIMWDGNVVCFKAMCEEGFSFSGGGATDSEDLCVWWVEEIFYDDVVGFSDVGSTLFV